MSYGHADHLNADRSPDDQGGASDDGPASPVAPEWYERSAMRRILAARDIGGLYRALKDAGVTQRTIARLTGQSQSEVSEIMAGRQQFAVASVRRWEGGGQVSRTLSGVVLATVHVRSGEPDGLRLAHGAITSATKLSSARVRQRLEPLAAALEARSGGDHRELARMARQVATTRV